jgi:hypothetical protein
VWWRESVQRKAKSKAGFSGQPDSSDDASPPDSSTQSSP